MVTTFNSEGSSSVAKLYRTYRIAATGISLLILIGLTIYVFYVSFETESLFSWHPSFMTLGFTLLMSEAIMVMSQDNIFVFLRPSIRNTIRHQHWVLQVGGAICILVGFVTIIENKNSSGSNHFHSFHSIIGLIGVICCFITCVGGIGTFYSVKLKDWLKPSYNKLAHIIIGTLTFVFGAIAEGTGFDTRTFSKDPPAQVACIVLLSLVSFVVFEGAVKTAYSRIKRLFM